jgi:hypothetical protein
MRVLLVGEGPSELAGALQNLVSRLADTDLEINIDRISRREIHAHHGKGRGFFKRAVRWMLEARKRGYDAIVLVSDEDGRAERTHEINEAQQYGGTPIRRALGVAIRTFDAWMLADEIALTDVLEYQVPRQQNPENIMDPKGVCRTLLNNSARPMNSTEMYAALAGAVNLDVIERRCERGFAPFARRVRQLNNGVGNL